MRLLLWASAFAALVAGPVPARAAEALPPPVCAADSTADARLLVEACTTLIDAAPAPSFAAQALVARAGELVASGGQWLYGHSRKSFLGGPVETRDAATLACSRQLAAAGVQYLRVHDVAMHRGAL